MRFLFNIILAFYFTTANSQENPLQTGIEVANLSAPELLTKAKSLQHNDRTLSFQLANDSLRLSKNNKDFQVSAQAHTLLGELAQQAKDIEQALQHFLHASLIYKNINDKQNQITSSIVYAETFFVAKRYVEGDEILDELLPIAKQYGEELPIALLLITKGNGYYQQKHYNDAIAQYTPALKYLSSTDEVTQRYLADTYKIIAQSYKRLKNREQTASFYTKALERYTALENPKSMARTLNTLAEAERYLGNYVIALDYSIRGLKLHEQLDDPIGHAKALMGAGIIFRHIGSYEKSLEHIHRAHLLYKKMNDANGIAKTSNEMGFIYTRLDQFDQARSFYQVTIDQPEKKLDPQTLATALREMAVIYLESGDYESAKVMAQKAHKIYQNENEKSKASISARIIGNIYRAQQDNTNAIAYYRESLSFATEIGSEIYQIKAQTPLAGILIGENTEEAVDLLKKALELSIKIDSISQKLYIYRELRKAEKSRGNIAESLHYAEEEIALSKIIQEEREDNELVLVKAKLYSHKKEMELESLKEITKLDQIELIKKKSQIEIAEQQRKISELELTKNKYASIALSSLLAICLLVVIFISRRFIHSRNHNKELGYLAARDPLTNCYNRRFLFDLMNRDFADLELLGEYCIILADIDQFKAVNDNYGHTAGDSVLRAVSEILQDSIRQNDIVARFGGEEFCIVLPGASQDQAMRIAETIRQKIETSHFEDITVTCSFGVTSIEFNAKAPKELINQADLALYKSKSNGRNQVTLWDQSLER
jgi:diguanylate cyclase (GGDEF)-like protein